MVQQAGRLPFCLITNPSDRIAGRLTGVITVTATTLGAQGPEGFAPAFLIDLAKEYTGKIEGYVIESLTFTPDVAGDDFAVTVSQWATN